MLANEAPTTIYQTFALDSTAIVTQYINTDYTAESGITTTTDALLDIIITALTDQDTDSLPERIVPNTTINVKTGTYEKIEEWAPGYDVVVFLKKEQEKNNSRSNKKIIKKVPKKKL